MYQKLQHLNDFYKLRQILRPASRGDIDFWHKCKSLIIRRLPPDMQKVSFEPPKAYLLRHKRRSFAAQKAVFCKTTISVSSHTPQLPYRHVLSRTSPGAVPK